MLLGSKQNKDFCLLHSSSEKIIEVSDRTGKFTIRLFERSERYAEDIYH